MSDAPERTLTAQLAPHAGERPTTPLLLLCARAGVRRPADAERMLVATNGLQIGRRAAGAPPVLPGALLLDDAAVSSRHARLVRDGDDFFIEDDGSKNGTFVDGVRVQGRAPLFDGACLFFGDHVFVFRVASAAAIEAIRGELAAPLAPVATTSPRLALLCAKLRRLAVSQAEVLLVGETGVGKEVYARAVHEASGRRGRFVALNCAAIPRELVESELFGFRPGAHSTAQSAKSGLLEAAEGGTLFLDEIGEMNPEVQAKLLRFLQDKQLTPLGATRPRMVDVRVVAATNRVVAAGSGSVRDDLLGRLGAAPITLPPLRERREDLGALAGFFLERLARPPGAPRPPGFDTAALRMLALCPFPLNVRELEKLVIAAAALGEPGAPIGLAELPDTLRAPPAPPPPFSAAPSIGSTPSGRKPPEPAPSAETLADLLARHQGNVADVARALGRQRAAVWRWIKRYGLEPDRFR